MSISETLPTRSGVAIHVRQATPDDEAALASFFDAVSAEDRRFRFFSAVDHVGHEQLMPLVSADHWQSESFVALIEDDAIVASGMMACDKAMDTAEIAISVHADYRGKGIGWAMLDKLAREAERRGVRRVIAIESRDNHAAIELEREKGFVPQPFDGDPTLVILTKTINATA